MGYDPERSEVLFEFELLAVPPAGFERALTPLEGNAVHGPDLAKRITDRPLGSVWGERKARTPLYLVEPCPRPASVPAARCVTHAGEHSAHRGPDWRTRYRIDQDSHTVVVLDVSR